MGMSIARFDQKSIYVYGGRTSTSTNSPTIWKYDYGVGQNEWKQVYISCSGNPEPRESAIMFQNHQKYLYIYGGYNLERDLYLSNMWRFDTERHKWQQIFYNNENFPSPRIPSIAIENGIMMYGGMSKDGIQGDLWHFQDGEN
eukprot:TRINITY_DN1995_c0_g1_i1.p1 TRINITY_DN1995_c0_g1~~TRINITY_DN1995_c0_g1_i1.p1  ORF type:complete len:143 (+),score=26.64 TRINITY_DN1995_c0_g1_i1:647-1075(+)